MHCKACNNELGEKDLFSLPNGEVNDLCSKCLQLVREDLIGFDKDLPADEIDLYAFKLLCDDYAE